VIVKRSKNLYIHLSWLVLVIFTQLFSVGLVGLRNVQSLYSRWSKLSPNIQPMFSQ
jgi:hypothetical protein